MPFKPSASGRFYLAAREGVLSSADGESWSLLRNAGGRTVGLAVDDNHLFSANQWSSTDRSAEGTDLGNWRVIAPPAALLGRPRRPYLGRCKVERKIRVDVSRKRIRFGLLRDFGANFRHDAHYT